MSKIKRNYLEPYLYGFTAGVLTGNLVITSADPARNYLDPGGVNRTVTFSGTFNAGDIFVIRNVGTSNFTLTVTNTSSIINRDAEYTFLYNGSTWVAYQTVGGGSSIATGAVYVQDFASQNSVTNKWLGVDVAIASNNTPAVCPYNCKLKGVAFSNATNNAGTDLELYVNGTAVAQRVYTFQVRTARYAWAEYSGADININFGDRLACYCRDVAGQADPTYVYAYFSFIVTSLGTGAGEA